MKWITLMLRLAPVVVSAVHAVERVVKGAKGKEKQDAAVEIVGALLAGAENLAGRDLLQDEKVQQAVRHAIDAVVALENAVAAAKAARQPAA